MMVKSSLAHKNLRLLGRDVTAKVSKCGMAGCKAIWMAAEKGSDKIIWKIGANA
jgi:hypothetical protein